MLEPQNPLDILWDRLAQVEPREAAARALVAHEADASAFRVPLCGRDYLVFPRERKVEGPEGAAGFEATLLCVQYLLTARDEPLACEWVTPQQLPYGEFFFRPPHELPTGKLEAAFGSRLEAFRRAGRALRGRVLEMGDAAWEFRALPRVPIAVVLWAADEEFPARARFLFDRRADRQLPIDALWLLTIAVAKALVAAGT